MYSIDTCPNLECRSCKFFRINADFDSVDSVCKRIDHKKVRFAEPWFKSYDCGYSHCICSNFVPANPDHADFDEWTCFDDYWKVYVKAWLPYENENAIVGFTLGSDTSVRYIVPLMSFINGSMIEGSTLNAVERKRYIKHRVSEKHPFGYELRREKIRGVDIDTGICLK